MQLRVIPLLEIVGKFVQNKEEKPQENVLQNVLIKNARINVVKLNIKNLVSSF